MTFFGDGLAYGVAELRVQAESAMVDAVLIESPTGESTLDPETNEVISEFVTVYEGKCRVVPTVFKDTEQSAGETVFDLSDVRLALPITAESGAVRNGARATIMGVDPVVGDPANVGRVFTLQRDPDRSHPVERRFAGTEVS